MRTGTEIHAEALRLILGSISSTGDRLLSSFTYGPPGAPAWYRPFGADVFVDERRYIRALLYIRQNGAPFLRDISIGSLWSLTTNFLTNNFGYIASGFHFHSSEHPILSNEVFDALAKLLGSSSIFEPEPTVTIYPLSVVRVKSAFQSQNFSLVTQSDLESALHVHGASHPNLIPDRFPPFDDGHIKPNYVSDWLCINAPDPLVARKKARVVLGALALTPIRRERYLQTGRSVHGGSCTFSSMNYSWGDSAALTPRIPSDISITDRDQPWLIELNSLLKETDLREKSKIRALEYFHRAWFDDPRERFPTLCMSLDSLVSSQNSHTKAALDFVISLSSFSIDRQRLALLMKLRGAVIHGAAPDVYESRFYEDYYDLYGVDPISDLEIIVAHCLRKGIFGNLLAPQDDPHAAIIKQQQAAGRIPKNLEGRAIIPEG